MSVGRCSKNVAGASDRLDWRLMLSGVVVAIAIIGAIIAATRLPRHADPEITMPAPPG